MKKHRSWKPFTADQAEKLKELLAVPEEVMACPACGSRLTMAPPASGASSTAYWEIHCEHCGRGQILQDLL